LGAPEFGLIEYGVLEAGDHVRGEKHERVIVEEDRSNNCGSVFFHEDFSRRRI
jgi:hypothetical protein